jgi:gamma-glutamylcyclotransferase (GGCT)/AIG2-like uncharacterized protein YtfP
VTAWAGRTGAVRPEVSLSARRLPFFVYGTLLPGERNHGLLAGRTRSWAAAELPGALLFHGPGVPYPYPYAVADPGGTGTVQGGLAAVAEEHYDEVLDALDLLEGYVPGRGGDHGGNHYERVAARVRTVAGETEAWTYVAGDRVARELRLSGVRVAHGDWRRRAGG